MPSRRHNSTMPGAVPIGARWMGPIAPVAGAPAGDTFPIQLAVVDADWKIVGVNEAWTVSAQRTGFGKLLAVGKSYRRFCEWCLMSGLDPAERVLEAIDAIDESRSNQFMHNYISSATGEHLQIAIATFETGGARFATVSRIDMKELLGLRRERLQLNANLMRAQSRLLRAQEEERKRIARELHDNAAQHLTGMNLALAYLRQASDDPAVLTVADDLTGMLDLFYRDLRGLTYVLHPPELEKAGLHEAVRSLCTGLARRAGIEVSLRIYGEDRMRGSTVEATLYRVLQEALINVHRHSGAKRVRVRLSERPGALALMVEDNGKGMSCGCEPAASMGVGVPGMIARVHELGGRFVIRNRRRGTGTVIGALVPRHGAGQAFLVNELTALQQRDEEEAAPSPPTPWLKAG